MARPLRLHIPGALYHVLSRGNAKQSIFVDDADYRRFLDLMTDALMRYSALCRAYCLMWNHFHLLVEVGAQPLSRMMQQLNSTYGQWFNRQHDRVGHVFQGRFKALLIDRDEYFLQVLRYIVLNPVKAGLVADPAEWRWSSYKATAGCGEVPACLALQGVWKAFDEDLDAAPRRFVDFVGAGARQEPPAGPVVFGSAAFTAQVGAALSPLRTVCEVARAERFAVRPTLDQLTFDALDRATAMREAVLRHGYTLREIADYFGCHPSTVLRGVRRAE